jgi:16S rRNA (guanine1207-N2)-methyltransferase
MTTAMGDRFRGTLRLARVPRESDPSLRAWDSADDLLFDWLEGLSDGGAGFPAPTPVPLGETIVIGDRFGALTLSLLLGQGASAVGASRTDATLRVYDDSVLTGQAIGENARSARGLGSGWCFGATPDLSMIPRGSIRRVIVKIPRSRGALEGILHDLRPALAPDACVIGAGMTRHIHRSTLDAMEAIVGPTRTSHAQRKARLIHTSFDVRLAVPPNPWPHRWTHDGLRICSYPGVFSAEGLDQGTRVLLAAFPDLLADFSLGRGTAIDLGCGNGILGTALAVSCPEAALEFRDMSFNALRSASETFSQSHPDRPARFIAADALEGCADASVDLIVCNPPFHARGARSDRTAWAMFSGARRVLRPGGELWVVGNRHLAYAAKLKRLFGAVELVGSSPKFVVARARVAR